MLSGVFLSGGFVARAAMMYLVTQVEAGVTCSLVDDRGGGAGVRHHPDLAERWEPKPVSQCPQLPKTEVILTV